ITQLKAWFTQQINEDEQTFARWAAKFLSGEITSDEMPAENHLPGGNYVNVEPNPFVRFNFIRLQEKVYLCAGGEEFEISLALAKKITSKNQMNLSFSSGQDKTLILELLQRGYLLEVEQ
ncbi:MAG: hypothetical protein GY694_16335, partial [Gammaproteobacteria bacterium]|nr:hypothetical protein [Gammaproteobacteria bacterium]